MTHPGEKRGVTNQLPNLSALPVDAFREIEDLPRKYPKSEIRKLEKNLLQNGWVFPIFVWARSKKNPLVIKGKARLRAARNLIAAGVEVAPVPYVAIKVKNEKEARELALFAISNYSRITNKGALDFVRGLELDPVTLGLNIPKLDLSEILGDTLEDSADPVATVILDFEVEEYKELLKALDKIRENGEIQASSDAEALFELVRQEYELIAGVER